MVGRDMEIVRSGHKVEAFFGRKSQSKESKRRLHEINEPWRRAEAELGEMRSARVPTADFRNPDGSLARLPVADVRAIEKKARLRGMVERVRYGGLPVPAGWVLRSLTCSCGQRQAVPKESEGLERECAACGELALVLDWKGELCDLSASA